jgi:hypothetical protein
LMTPAVPLFQIPPGTICRPCRCRGQNQRPRFISSAYVPRVLQAGHFAPRV